MKVEKLAKNGEKGQNYHPLSPPGAGAARAMPSRGGQRDLGFRVASSYIELPKSYEAQSEIELHRVKSSFELQFTIGTSASPLAGENFFLRAGGAREGTHAVVASVHG